MGEGMPRKNTRNAITSIRTTAFRGFGLKKNKGEGEGRIREKSGRTTQLSCPKCLGEAKTPPPCDLPPPQINQIPEGAQIEARTHRNPAWNMYIRGAPGLAYLGVVKMFSFFRDT